MEKLTQEQANHLIDKIDSYWNTFLRQIHPVNNDVVNNIFPMIVSIIQTAVKDESDTLSAPPSTSPHDVWGLIKKRQSELSDIDPKDLDFRHKERVLLTNLKELHQMLASISRANLYLMRDHIKSTMGSIE